VGAAARPRADLARAAAHRQRRHLAVTQGQGQGRGAVDWDALAARWDATLGGELAGIAPAVSNARGAGVSGHEHHGGCAPAGPPTRETQARALAKVLVLVLVLVSDKHPAWTRHDLLKQLALVMPAETRQMDPQAAQELMLGLTEEALSSRTSEVLCLEAPEWPRVPASLRRELDGRSIYTRPGEVAAQRLGAEAALLEMQLRGRAHDTRANAAPRGLRLDQGAAVWHVLTSPRTVEVITGPGRNGQDPGPGHRRLTVGRPGVRYRHLPERHQRTPGGRRPGRRQHRPIARRHR
jgi:hypothetical protein